MPDTKPLAAAAHVDASACNEAFRALLTYDSGSPRSLLLPIDDAVAASSNEPAARARLEARLLEALQKAGSTVAKEYVCSQLASIGAKAAVPALARLLLEPQLVTAARNALERIPGEAPVAALRKALPQARGDSRLGIVQSLGVRRDAASLRLLSEFLQQPEFELACAAAAALGEIGSARAGWFLAENFARATASLRQAMADSLLVCAERAEQEGRRADAQALLKLLAGTALPSHVRQAAERGRRRLAGAT